MRGRRYRGDSFGAYSSVSSEYGDSWKHEMVMERLRGLAQQHESLELLFKQLQRDIRALREELHTLRDRADRATPELTETLRV